ncbi:MAG: enoyl-CoA hydratase/isomerase family protein [Acidobacteria bacterium]|nr:enoyl-CoA hydratase/isomerase family protein [Acidobacteriota bacterium]
MDARKYKTLGWRKDGFCIVVDLNDLPADEEALSQRWTDFSGLCEQIAWDEETRIVVLFFGGRMHDLPDRISSGEAGVLSPVEAVSGIKRPVIAAVRGDATDLVLELALACDLRIATDASVFAMRQTCRGRIPSNGGTQRLPRLIGQSRAIKMILTGESIDAAQALKIGLVHRVVAPDALEASAMELARQMALKSPLSLHFAKEALYSGMDLTLDQGIGKEMDLYLLLFGASDRTEGINAFKEKRKPEFKGE